MSDACVMLCVDIQVFAAYVNQTKHPFVTLALCILLTDLVTQRSQFKIFGKMTTDVNFLPKMTEKFASLVGTKPVNSPNVISPFS